MSQFAKEPRWTITRNSWKTTSPSFSQQILKYLNFRLKTINYSEKTVIKSSTTKKYRQFVYKLMSFLNIFNKKKFVVICMASSYWITNIISNFYNIFTQWIFLTTLKEKKLNFSMQENRFSITSSLANIAD